MNTKLAVGVSTAVGVRSTPEGKKNDCSNGS